MNEILNLKDVTLNFRSIKSFTYRDIFKQRNKDTSIFTAIDQISFSINQGDVLGIIGANGAGKSTLLRIIAGIYKPDQGVIIRNYDKDSLLSLGIGFQSRLTGRENIYLSGLALGFNQQEIQDIEHEIVEFSELEEFIDKPVKTYSSGMYSKLSFSINVMLDCDLLLIDEVLSVGDIRFRKKSFNKLKETILNDSQTVILVSHSISSINKLCNKVLWLDHGKVRLYDETSKVVNEYTEFMNK